MTGWNWKRTIAAAALLTLGLALSACLLTPGRFTSALDLRKDGRFTFTYTGEIHVLALSKLAQMGDKKTFEPDKCYDDDMKERTCTADELAEQKKSWDEEQKANAEKNKKDAEGMKAMLGGLDPSDPKAAEELAERLRRQVGWKSVVYKGDGLYLVDFALSGRLDHDFAFPTIERFPMSNPFVQLTRRADGTVRMDATGFGPGSGGMGGGGNPFAAMMGGAMASGPDGKPDPAQAPQYDGTFTLTTDGTVLANNTDEGPKSDPAGQKLLWMVNPRIPAAPTALVKLAN